VYKTSFEFEYYKEAILYRIIELAEATIILLDSGNYLGAVTIARSLQETTAMMWYMHEECAKAVESKNLKNFATTMKKLMLGCKVDNEELLPDPVHVNVALRMVDKTLPSYFRCYEILCGYAHPNWSGTMGLFADAGGEELKVEFGRYIRGKDTIITQITESLLGSLGLTSYTQKTHKDIIRKLNDLCRDLHAKGQLNEAIGIGKKPANE
jgi:predicted transcriptional regulator